MTGTCSNRVQVGPAPPIINTQKEKQRQAGTMHQEVITRVWGLFFTLVQERRAELVSVGAADTHLRGAGGTGRRGADGTFLDEVEPRWDWREAEVLHAVARLSSVGFSVLADR